jgi:hypothetical protein
LKKFNQGLKDLKKDGSYDKIVAKYISTGSGDQANFFNNSLFSPFLTAKP